MTRLKSRLSLPLSVAATVCVFLISTQTSAKPEYLRTVALAYPIWQTRIGKCVLCHTKGGGSARSRFGRTFFAFGADAKALESIENDDSDFDGFTNLEEIVSLTLPGDPRDKPKTKPTAEEIQTFMQKQRVAPAAILLSGITKKQIVQEVRSLRQRLDALEAMLAQMPDDAEPPALQPEEEGEAGFEIDLGEGDTGEEGGFEIDLVGTEPAPVGFGGQFAPAPSAGLLGSAIENIKWGGALDVWFRWVDEGESTSMQPLYNGRGTREFDAMIHVAELVVTTKIGDNITLLGEALLPTEEGLGFRQLVAEKHGFFYAIFSNLPYLPRGSTIWLGRFRNLYGIDAVLDAPASPLDTLVTKITGQISDIGLMFKGFRGPFEWSVAVADGADYNRIAISDNGIPLYARTDLDLSKFMPGLHIGLSGFLGEHYRYADGILRTPASITGEDIVGKERLTFHAQVPAGKFDFLGEVTIGRDDDDDFNAYFFRTDYNFTSKLVGHLVWDYIDTEFKETKLVGDPDPNLARLATGDFTGNPEQFIRGGVSYHLSEQIIMRLIGDFKVDGSDNLPENVVTTQLLLEF